MDNPADRATEMPKLFSARPTPTLPRRLASIFLNSQVNYCVDKGRVPPLYSALLVIHYSREVF